jgi:hypothetical protein
MSHDIVDSVSRDRETRTPVPEPIPNTKSQVSPKLSAEKYSNRTATG